MDRAVSFDPNLILALVASNTSGANDEQLRRIYVTLQQHLREESGDESPLLEELWCSDLIAESMAIRALAKSSLLFSEGRVVDALETLEAIAFLEKNPWTAEVLNNLAVLRYELGNKSEALTHIQSAFQLAPKDIVVKGNFTYLSEEGNAAQCIAETALLPEDTTVSITSVTSLEARDDMRLPNDEYVKTPEISCFSLNHLLAPGPYPDGIDTSRREEYLNDEDFKDVLEMSKEAFKAIPKWRQVQLKKMAKLF